ncbi:MAG TPA: Bax inhibitor-1/YccA family protein [Bacteroidales bacterium]|nr:Bax inhibitor-1/YccA family protein [Bacteroidales bacterium]
MFSNQNQNSLNYPSHAIDTVALSKTFLSNVFAWMFLGMMATAGTAWIFADNTSLMSLLVTETGMSVLGWVVIFAPLALVLLLSFGYQKLSSSTMVVIFVAYSILMGMSLSFIFLVYQIGSIATTFAITAGMFGGMALLGYTTRTDLTKFGSILIMALIGIIIATVVNVLILRSSMMDYVISLLGVLIFTGLTAYDVQKLKRIGSQVEQASEDGRKLTIMGALTLYLDFINLFLFLLRFLGNRK